MVEEKTFKLLPTIFVPWLCGVLQIIGFALKYNFIDKCKWTVKSLIISCTIICKTCQVRGRLS